MKPRLHNVLAVCVLLGVVGAMAAQATPKTQKAFTTRYTATAGTRLAKCATCHTAKAPALNDYGKELKLAKLAFEAVEKLDSDKDGAANLDEIKALTLPGDPKDKPAAAAADSAKKEPPAPPDSSGAPGDTTRR